MPISSARSRWRARPRSPTSTRPRRWPPGGRGANHEFRRCSRPPAVPHPVADHRRPAGPLSRQRRLGADARGRARRRAHLRDDQPRQRAARRASPGRARHRGLRERPRRGGGLSQRRSDGDRVHRRLHGGDQSRGLLLRLAAEAGRSHHPVGAGAPFQHRALAAAAAAERHRDRRRAGHRQRPHRPQRLAAPADARAPS